MDKETGKFADNAANKMPCSPESLLDAASLFGAAAGVYHPLMGPMGVLPSALAAVVSATTVGSPSSSSPASNIGSAGVSSGLRSTTVVSSSGYSVPSSTVPVTAAVSAVASSTATYNNTFTLSAAANQAANLQGMNAWWSMAQQLAAHDYMTRMQANALNISGGFMGSTALSDPYAAVAALSLSAASNSHTSSSASCGKSTSSKYRNSNKNPYGTVKHQQQFQLEHLQLLSAGKNHSSSSSSWRKRDRDRDKYPNIHNIDNKNFSIRELDLMTAYGVSLKDPLGSNAPKESCSTTNRSTQKEIYSNNLSLSTGSSFMLEKELVLANQQLLVAQQRLYGYGKYDKQGDRDQLTVLPTATVAATTSTSMTSTTAVQYSANTSAPSSLPINILSDPHTILGDVRLPPDTEIIKYTSSIVGPKIPGTTNRGRKKTISLDHGSSGSGLSTLLQQQNQSTVRVNTTTTESGTSMSSSGQGNLVPAHTARGDGTSLSSIHTNVFTNTRSAKRPKLDDNDDHEHSMCSDRVDVIKLPIRNGGPVSYNYNDSIASGNSETPLNLSLKPSSKHSNHHASSSLSSLSNMSANIGLERISRRKPGPKPRRVPPSTSPLPPPQTTIPSSIPPETPSASLTELFATAAGFDETMPIRPSSNCEIDFSAATSVSAGKDTRPRNLGRGVSKPKKNTVASLLAQSRALDPNASVSQQMSLLKSNILAAQQYIAEVGGDEKTLNKFLQDKFRGTLSDSSTMDASTDSDNLTDSNQTDSEMESSEQSIKRSKQHDEKSLRVPLEKGWRRETIIRGITKNGAIRGDVTYVAPESSNKFKQMSDITQYLDYQKSKDLTKENFTFSCRVILGDYIHMVAPEYSSEGEYVRMTQDDVIKRLDDLKTSMRTNIPVEQRIEVARRQQAARAAARLDREQARHARELERSERLEASRREKEAKTQLIFEAKKKKQEELERHKLEEQQKRQKEREVKRQQSAIIKEQERERRRQHITLVKALENRRKLEERERKKQQVLSEKQTNKEKKVEQRRIEMDILTELRKPCEDLEIDQKLLPEFERIPGLKLSGKAFGDILMVFEFLHNFGETLGFDMESIPSLDSLQLALLVEDGSNEAEEELLTVMTHLIICAIEDPGIPNPARHTTLLGHSLRSADITHSNLSEILRIYLYANATGEVKTLTGVSFERDREKRVADHHQTDIEMQSTQGGKNAAYYEKLHANSTWKMADMLRNKPFMSLSPTNKAAILSFICNELLQNKAVIRQIDNSMDSVAISRKEKWIFDAKARKLKMLYNKKTRAEAIEKTVYTKSDGTIDETGSIESLVLHKDDLLDEDDIDLNISENESVGTQSEEDEDAKLSAEELGKKLEKTVKTVEDKLNSINAINYQMRAICYGQDRFFRRYWSLPKAGGIFIEAMESAEPSELILQFQEEQLRALDVRASEEIEAIIEDIQEEEEDIIRCNEMGDIIDTVHIKKSKARSEITEDHSDDDINENFSVQNLLQNGEVDHELRDLQRNLDHMVEKLNKYEASIKSEVNDIHTSLIANVITSNENDVFETDFVESKEVQLFGKMTEYFDEDALKDSTNEELHEDLKRDVLSDIKTESSADSEATENNEQYEYKWFSILNKDGSCEGVQLCSGNKWDHAVGICTRDKVTELKIPVFPLPASNILNTTNPAITCESPTPLQITPEEMVQMEYIKEHGFPKPVEKALVYLDKRYGWWRILDIDTLQETIANLHIRGVRERELKRTIINVMQSMYEQPNKLYIELGYLETTSLYGYNFTTIRESKKRIEGLLNISDANDLRNKVEKSSQEFQLPSCIKSVPGLPNVPKPDAHDAWFPHISQKVNMTLLEQVEALEDKVANASMQMKGWKIPNKYASETSATLLVQFAKERLSSLEAAIERRYLKPPLGVIISDPNLVVIAQEAAAAAVTSIVTVTSSCSTMFVSTPTVSTVTSCTAGAQNEPASPQQQSMVVLSTTSAPILRSASPQHHLHVELTPSGGNLFCATPVLPNLNTGSNSAAAVTHFDEIPKALTIWRDGVNRAQTSAQLAMFLYTLESSIAWDKSIMKANCQFCNSGDNEDKLLLCDSCDKGYHTYCFKPKIDRIPEGDWYCHECMNKAKGEKNCIVCGKRVSNTGTKLVSCEACPRAYHTDCIRPNMSKAPRGKWYCSNCISKKPQKKVSKKNCSKRELPNNIDSLELVAPASPTLSHSSATTNEDISVTPHQQGSSGTVNRSLSPLCLPTTAVENKQQVNSVISPATIVAVTTFTTVTTPSSSTCTFQEQQFLQGETLSSNSSSIPKLSTKISPQASVVTITSASPVSATASDSLQSTPVSASGEPTNCGLNINNSMSASLSISNIILTTPKKDKTAKRLLKDLTPCKAILEDLECHDDAWPFLLPVNTKQFPTYKRIIKNPMDLSTIKKKIFDGMYKTKEEFGTDVRQIFNNCETYNEDDSPVGKAGHFMRQFFESRWNEHFLY